MTALPAPIDLSALELRVLIWPTLFGLGAYLVLTAQPIGRPKPDLAERLRRLDVDERIRAEIRRRDVRPIFASRILEGMFRPALDDLGYLLRTVLGRFGLGGKDLERRLSVARPGVEPVQFYGEKLLSGLIGLGLFPLMNGLGIHPFGTWPVWIWGVAFLIGFLAPDWELDRRLTARRTKVVMDLPVILDMLTITTSAGLALEQSLNIVAQQSQGVMGQELQHAVRELALGQRSLIEALEAMTERNAIPELTSFVDHLSAAHEQGMPLVQALVVQAEALRERKRLRIIEMGGKASIRMLLPVAVFILPVLFVVLLVPAAVELLNLGG
jgi:tight adherence protein C